MPTYTLRINGESHRVEGEAADTLLGILRYELGLSGSKYGCGEGHCGACTVLVDGEAVRSCMLRLGAIGDRQVTTIEALAPDGALHPVQEAFLDQEAFQCGYCTPGMIMATVAFLRRTPNPTEPEIARALDRHVCRCGTYPRIVRAVQRAAGRMRTEARREQR